MTNLKLVNLALFRDDFWPDFEIIIYFRPYLELFWPYSGINFEIIFGLILRLTVAEFRDYLSPYSGIIFALFWDYFWPYFRSILSLILELFCFTNSKLLLDI